MLLFMIINRFCDMAGTGSVNIDVCLRSCTENRMATQLNDLHGMQSDEQNVFFIIKIIAFAI